MTIVAPGYSMPTTSTSLVSTSSLPAPTSSSSSSSTSSSSSSIRSTTSTSTTIVAGALGFYVGPNGSDSTGTGERAKPFRTINKAIAVGRSGDTVVLLDNSDSQPYASFTANKSFMSIRAEHEGQAAIITTGLRAAEVAASNVRIEGLAMRSADGSSCNDEVLRVSSGVTGFQLIRSIVGWNNRRCNSHPIKLIGTNSASIIENACLNHSRHCISFTGGSGHKVLRNHIDNRGRGPLLNPPPGGTSQEAIALYPSTKSLVANNLVEGSKSWGININATALAEQVRILGNIVAGTYLGMKLNTRPGGVVLNALVQDQIFARITGGSYEIRDSATVKTVYDHMTAYAGALGVDVLDPSTSGSSLSCVDSPQDPSMAIRNSILGKLSIKPCSGVTRGCEVTNTIATSKSIMSGCNVSGLTSTLPADLGDSGAGKCLVDTSSPLGADVKCRIDDAGNLTNDPLWGSDGQFRFCPPVRAGWNSDPANRCDTFAERKLNHKRDGSGCPAARWACS